MVAAKPDSVKMKANRRAEVEKFRETFRSYSIEKLQIIIKEKKLVPTAITAAQELLAQRLEADNQLSEKS